MGWLRRVDPHWVDVALVTAVVLASTLGVAGTEPQAGDRSALHWALGVLVALPLLARRRAPEGALLAITAVSVFQGTLLREMPGFGAFLALLIGAFSVGMYAGLGSGLAAMAICLAGVVLVGAVAEPLSVEGVVIPFVYLGAAWGIGRLVGARTERAVQAADEAERLVRDQAQREEAILADERARISRELHDVVAHAVTTMVLQAGAAQAELAPDDGSTRARLETIESSGRQALDELRRVLTVMRDPDTTGVPAPMPGLADLGELAGRTSASGVEVDLRVEVNRELSPGLSLSIYRIVQEALTNVLRHASGSRASVRVWEQGDEVRVEVTDDGRGRQPSDAGVGSGRGLIGMRERAAIFGGTVEAGSDAGSGFRVRVHLPLRETAQ